jgi:hypothetical protein
MRDKTVFCTIEVRRNGRARVSSEWEYLYFVRNSMARKPLTAGVSKDAPEFIKALRMWMWVVELI